jgi:predicted ribosomally synthesized peptide with SipW-like signal peptide
VSATDFLVSSLVFGAFFLLGILTTSAWYTDEEEDEE